MEDMAKFFNAADLAALQRPRPTTQAPQLVLLKQNSHSEEKISKNGIPKLIFVVVKSSPFNLVLGSSAAPGYKPLDFNHFAFDASLIYDGDQEKEVDYVKVKPIDIKTQVGENGESISIEVRIKVLTSHHEDMLFRIKIRALDPITHQEFNPSLHVYSGPIKVISKPEQLKKRVPSRKRTLNDILVDTVTRIEKQQEEHQKLIVKLLDRPAAAPAVAVTVKQSGEAQPLDAPLAALLAAYTALPHHLRAESVRKLVRQASARDTEQLAEMLDMFWSEGLHHTLQHSPSSSLLRPSQCPCSDCPHKQELDRIDEFYKEFLSAPLMAQNPNLL